MLGTGLIGLFYTRTLHGQRNRDRVEVVYSRSQERAEAFARENDVPQRSTDLEEAIAHPDTDTVVIGLPNHLHLEAVELCAKHGKAVLCTKPLARNGAEAKRILDIAEGAGIFGGYLEDLVYSPKTLKAVAAVQAGQIGQVTWARSRETHPGPHSAWFWDAEQAGGGAVIDLGCHCIEIIRSYMGKGNRPARGDGVDRHARAPDRGRGQRDRADQVRVGRDRPVRGLVDVPRRHGPARRGRRHRGDDLDEPLPPHRLRDVLVGRGRRLRRGEGRVRERLAVPGRRRGRRARLRRHVHGHVRLDRRGARADARASTTATSSTR